MYLTVGFLGLAILSAVAGVVFAMLIVRDRQQRGLHVNWVLLKLKILMYLDEYRHLTRTETGRVGPLFYGYVICMNLALFAAIIGLLLRGA